MNKNHGNEAPFDGIWTVSLVTLDVSHNRCSTKFAIIHDL